MDHDKEDMFHRIITPCEKHRHLRIPRRNAEFFEPRRAESGQNYVFIPFTDDSGKVWEFRYCQWKKRGSCEYAFSDRTWLPFAKAMKLKEKDTVTFRRGKTNKEQFFIGCTPAENTNGATQQPSGGYSGQAEVTPRATSYESMDVHKEPMFSKPLCKTDVWSRLRLYQWDAVTFFETLIVGSSTADRQNVTCVILFYDDTGEVWEFTYCQLRKRDGYDYAFSKGWLNFAKAKKLKENDTVTFRRGQTNKEQFFISYTRAGNINGAIQQPSGGDSGQPGQRHIDTDFDTILDQPYTDTMEQNPLANHPTPTAALLSSRTSDQGSPSPSAIAFAESILETENTEHSLSVARVRVPEITVPRVGSPSLNASETGIVPNTAVTDRLPTLNSDQIILPLSPDQITSTLRIEYYQSLKKIIESAMKCDYGRQDMIYQSLDKLYEEYRMTHFQEAQNEIKSIEAWFGRMSNMQIIDFVEN